MEQFSWPENCNYEHMWKSETGKSTHHEVIEVGPKAKNYSTLCADEYDVPTVHFLRRLWRAICLDTINLAPHLSPFVHILTTYSMHFMDRDCGKV